MSGGGGHERQLDQTPTWAVSLVCAIIVVISIALEKVIHKIAHVRFRICISGSHFTFCH